MSDELYTLLELERSASPADIKAAYRRLAGVHHPDRGGDPDAFVSLTKAYNVLSDPKSRAAYDESGKIDTDTAQKAQHRLMQNIAELLAVVLETINRPVEEVDIIGLMREQACAALDMSTSQLDRRRKALKSLKSVRDRIERKGDGRNMFLEIVEAKLKHESAEFNALEMHVSDVGRVIDELGNYKSIVDLARTMQATVYSTRADQASFFQIFTPPY